MQPVWLIEAGVYGDEIQPLLGEIRRQGCAAELIPHRALGKDAEVIAEGRSLEPDACVIGYGTYPFARQIQLHRRWRPGAWCSPENLDCTAYYAHFGRYLLNQNYAVMPGVEAIRQADWLFSTFARGGSVFIRPTGCHKLFVGRCVGREQFDAALAPARYDPTTLVVVASPRPIAREWRLVVCGDRVIGAGRYAVDGRRAVEPGCPAHVLEFAAAMLAQVRWRPDPLFMIDVGESEGSLRLVELNGFSCSWLYQYQLDEVVAAAGEAASREWASRRP